MGFRASFFKNTVAFGAMLVSLATFGMVKQRAEAIEKAPTRPISPGRSHWRGKNYPNARKPHSQVYLRQITKERAIGVNPEYRHASARNAGPSIAEWRKLSRQWDAANPITHSGRRYG